MVFPDSSSVLDKFQSARIFGSFQDSLGVGQMVIFRNITDTSAKFSVTLPE